MRPLLLIPILALSVGAFAQSLPSAPHLTYVQRTAFLLSDPSVRTKIGAAGLSPKIRAMFESYGKQQDRLASGKSPSEKAMEALDGKVADQLLGLLTPAQRASLARIAFRDSGPRALLATDVSAALKLTAAQKAKIEAVLAEAAEPRDQLEMKIAERLEKAANEAERQAIHREYQNERARLEQRQRAEERKALAVLTPAQRKALSQFGAV